MPNVEKKIDSLSITTYVVEPVAAPRDALRRRRAVSLGRPRGEEAFYVQLGTVGQIRTELSVISASHGSGEVTVTQTDLFNRGDKLMLQDPAEGVSQPQDMEYIKTHVEGGADLIEGVFVVPGHTSRLIPGTRGLWAPLTSALGKDWQLVGH